MAIFCFSFCYKHFNWFTNSWLNGKNHTFPYFCLTFDLYVQPWPLQQGSKYSILPLCLTMENICGILYWNHFVHVKVIFQTSIFIWPLGVTLTFDLETFILGTAHLLMTRSKHTMFEVNPNLRWQSYFSHFCETATAFPVVKFSGLKIKIVKNLQRI